MKVSKSHVADLAMASAPGLDSYSVPRLQQCDVLKAAVNDGPGCVSFTQTSNGKTFTSAQHKPSCKDSAAACFDHKIIIAASNVTVLDLYIRGGWADTDAVGVVRILAQFLIVSNFDAQVPQADVPALRDDNVVHGRVHEPQVLDADALAALDLQQAVPLDLRLGVAHAPEACPGCPDRPTARQRHVPRIHQVQQRPPRPLWLRIDTRLASIGPTKGAGLCRPPLPLAVPVVQAWTHKLPLQPQGRVLECDPKAAGRHEELVSPRETDAHAGAGLFECCEDCCGFVALPIA
mmetsp:Transcript_46524/g.132672  ORF Transcript_46524/g.132672 Transcript_46524/m.132672 type:complete len:291 (+) Transcript_46524:290-1162(+)